MATRKHSIADLQAELSVRVSRTTREGWLATLNNWIERLGEPDFTYGPTLSMRWLLADGAFELSPNPHADGCTVFAHVLDNEDLAAFDEEVDRDSRGGSAFAHESYLWFFWSPDAAIPHGAFCHGGFLAEDVDDLANVLKESLGSLISVLPYFPAAWRQHATVSWQAPVHASITVSEDAVRVSVHDTEHFAGDSSMDSLGEAIKVFVDAVHEYATDVDLYEIERSGSFSYGQWSMVTAG